MKKLILFTLFISSFSIQAQTTWTVDSLNDAGFGSLRAAKDSCVAGDTIRFNPNLIVNGSDSIVLTTGEIAFGNKGIIIKGLYNATDTLRISGNDSSRIFSFNGAGRVVLDSLVLINGFSNGSGGAISKTNSWDTLFVLNSIITGNNAISGGGVYGAIVSISNSTISDNKAILGVGGGIFALSVIATNSSILGNTTTSGFSTVNAGRGGAIYADLVSITNSMIMGNTASHASGVGSSYGGGIYSSYTPTSASAITVTNSTISGNSASYGGGICADASSISVINSTLSWNTASSGNGGGICSWFSPSSLVIESSTLLGNTASLGYGGGVFFEALSPLVVITNSNLSGNEASLGGGVYSKTYSSSGLSSVNIINSIVSGNTASSGDGGGIYSLAWYASSHSMSSIVAIENSMISGNTASSGNGGGVYSYSSTSSLVTITNSNVSGNSASSGGGISSESSTASTSSSVVVANSTVSGNAASSGGGGGVYSVSWHSSSSSVSSVTITNSTITGNTASSGTGRGIYSHSPNISSSFINVTSSIIAENGSNSNGIYNSNAVTISSGGYNIFSDTLIGTISFDSTNITAARLNLQALAFNGGATLTMLPGLGSVAINNGNPNDTSDAQNGPISGVRDVGAADVCLQFFTDTITSCASYYTWIDGNTYTTNGVATHLINNSLVCDTMITLNLTLNNIATTDTVHACDSIVWIDGQTYYPNHGTVSDTLINSLGCDSVVFLNFIPSNFGEDKRIECDSLTWLNGVTYYTNNNSASDTLISSFGCDSIVILDLTILNSSSFNDVVTSCDPITWIDGITYNQTTGSPIFTIPNSIGCDSVITLDFTLLQADTTVTRNYLTLTAQANNVSYQWIDCSNGIINGEIYADYTVTSNGSYKVEITQNGCVDTSACFAIMNVGVEETELIGVNIYPNPTTDILNIDKGSNESLEITITNSVGAVMHQSSSKNQITTINMAKMATGLYMVTLKNELGVKVEKVVKR